jgi:hypothetical protein
VFLLTFSGAHSQESWPVLSAENSGLVSIAGSAYRASINGTGDILIATKGASVTSSTTLFGQGTGSTPRIKTMSSNRGDVSSTGIFTSPQAVFDGNEDQMTTFSVQATGAVTTYSIKSD